MWIGEYLTGHLLVSSVAIYCQLAQTGLQTCRPQGSRVAVMIDPTRAPFAAVRLADVTLVTDVDPDYPDATDGNFHLVRRHFDIRSFGVNGITGNAGDEMVEPHHERDDEDNRTDGHEELFAVMSGQAVFTIDGDEVNAPAGTLVFVRDPALIRSARATADGTSILAVGGKPGAAYELSPWEQDLP
jgi:hypothetical protein